MSNIAQTSRESLSQVSLTQRKNLSDTICDVVVAACRNGAADMSMKEIQHVMRNVHGMSVEMSSISGRVNDLVKAGRLLRDQLHMRTCSISQRDIHPLSAPAQQTRAFY